MQKRVAIIGAGMLGLTLALRFADRGWKVEIYDSASEVGGLAAAWKIGDFVWDKHYHVTLLSDSYTRKLIAELGLEVEFEWKTTKTGFYTEGNLFSMSDIMDFLRFPPIKTLDKLRLGATIFYAAHFTNGKKLENVPIESWLKRFSGKTNFEKIWKPLLLAKLGNAYKQTSASFIWATIQRMYAARNSGLKKEMFGYIRGGYARILKRFADVLKQKDVTFHLNFKVISIESNDSGVFVKGCDKIEQKRQYSNSFDTAILTCPCSVASRILPQLPVQEKLKLDSVKYQGVICASILSRQSLSDFYITNITDEVPFTGIIEMTALVDKSHFGGNALIYLPKYASPDDRIFDKSDDEIEDLFLSSLERMYPHFSKSDVLAFRISRVRQVFPIHTIGYTQPPMKTSLPNIFIVNSSHIRYATLNVNETICLAERFLAEYFGSPSLSS